MKPNNKMRLTKLLEIGLLGLMICLSFSCVEVDFTGEAMNNSGSTYNGPLGDFGGTVSISKNYAIIGAWSENEFQGAAYFFKKSKDQWVQHQKISNSDGTADHDLFGTSVSIDGDYAIVGAHWDDRFGEDDGAAYIYKRTGEQWGVHTILLPDDRDSDFGISVSINGPYALIGAPHHKDLNGQEIGAVYVYYRDNAQWVKQEILTSSYPIPRSDFGSSVAVDEHHIIVGAANYEDHGRVFIYERENGQWLLKMTFDGKAYSRFGSTVAIDGLYALVGAPDHKNHQGIKAGSVYMYKRVNAESGPRWVNENIYTTSDANAYDMFGCSVSIYMKSESGGFAMIGARSDDNVRGINAGATYVMMTVNNTWTNLRKLIPSPNSANDSYGSAVSIGDGFAVIGAPNTRNRLGRVYFYK